MMNILARNKIKTDNIIYMPFGVSVENKHVPAIDTSNKKLNVGFIGSFSKSKGAHILLDSINIIPKENNICFKFYGDFKRILNLKLISEKSHQRI